MLGDRVVDWRGVGRNENPPDLPVGFAQFGHAAGADFSWGIVVVTNLYQSYSLPYLSSSIFTVK